ncbi:MAG: M48 family metallopeptidase [Bacteroidia bacterium]|nr:M48 family metallopeptidase [Bacteroidia bacterium]
MRLIVILSLFFVNFSFSQIAGNLERSYSNNLPDRFIIDNESLRGHIFSGVPASIRNGEYSRRALNFAHSNSLFISELISGGTVYSDWDELEDYLNKILKMVMPTELQKDSMIHAYIIRDGSYNAFMTASGHTFIHVGLIAEMQDESTLAGVLSHELAHYYLKHSLNRFMAEEAGEFDQGIISTGAVRKNFSVNQELQADSLAAIWVQRAGYSVQGLISGFKNMYRIERNILKKRRLDWALKERTHPLSEKRLSQLYKILSQIGNANGKSFIISESMFNRLKEEVKPEVLKSLINDFDYYECIEKSFKYHLFDPDNPTYVYYLMESIRRNAYLNVDIWKELFITNLYYDSVMVNGETHKEEMTDHLFKKFDLDIISIDPSDGVKLKARFYWRDKPKFTTYEEAYNFFFLVGQALKCKECVLSNALSYTSIKDKAIRNKFLEEYIKFDSTLHNEYAKCLLKDSINKSLPNNKIIAFNDLSLRIEQGYEKIRLPDKKHLFKGMIDSIMKTSQNRTAYFLPEYKFQNLNNFNDLKALQGFSIMTTVSKGERTELHILDPKYWELFYKLKVNEIEFVFPRYYEVRAKDVSLVGYQKVIDTDVSSVLGKTKQTKYFDVLISSIREIENAAMKIRHYQGENKLNDKENTSEQIAKIIKYELSIKESRAIEQDKKFRYNNNR